MLEHNNSIPSLQEGRKEEGKNTRSPAGSILPGNDGWLQGLRLNCCDLQVENTNMKYTQMQEVA